MSIVGKVIRRNREESPPPASTALAMPAGAVLASGSYFGTAADFYDSVGINFKPDAGGAYSGQWDAMVADVAEMGMRHARFSGGGRWSFIAYAHFNGPRQIYIRVRNRNNNLPAPSANDPGQPIFLLVDLPGWGHPSNLTGPFGEPPNTLYGETHWSFSMSRPYTVFEWFYGLDGGRGSGWGHFNGDGNPNIPDNMPVSHSDTGVRIPDGVTSNQNAVMPNPWDWEEPELDWKHLGAFSFQNEPWNGITQDNPGHALTRAWCQAVMVQKYDTYHSNKIIGGPPRLTTEGIKPGNQIRASQVPYHGVCVIPNGTIINHYGDMSKLTNTCDVGDIHPYAPGLVPNHERQNNRFYSANNPEGAVFNGRMSSPPTAANAIPWVCTELGHTTDTAMADPGVDPNAGGKIFAQNHNAWPTPEDIQAEFMVQQYLLHWCRDIRRTYNYELYDLTRGHFGIMDANRNPKAAFWAIRNMLALTTFSEPTVKQKLNLTVSGYPSLPTATYLDPAHSNAQWNAHAQGLDQIQMHVNNNTWLLWLRPQRKIYDRGVANWNASTSLWQAFAGLAVGRPTINPATLTIGLPAGTWTVEEASPTAGIVRQATAPYYTWPDPNAGKVWAAKSVSSGQVQLDLAANTKVLRIRN